MTELPISEIRGIRIGQVENTDAGTGCTVLICEDGMRAGVDSRGGGPASRETPLLNPLMAAQIIHAIVLGGGSAFGLGAANGVMKYLEEKKIGFDVGVTKVPLVVQSDIFDHLLAVLPEFGLSLYQQPSGGDLRSGILPAVLGASHIPEAEKHLM